MKILISSTCMPPETAGAEKVAWEITKRLAKLRNNEVHVLTTTKNFKKHPKIKAHIIPYIPPLTIFYSTLGYFFIKKLLLKHKFDIIHSHMSLPWGFIFRNSNSKKIVTLHGCEYLNKDMLYKFFARLAFKKSDLIISPSYWLKEYVKENYGYDSLVIRNGINTSKFKILKNVKKEKNVILFVGRLIKIKGIIELIAVAKELKNFEFWFAGKGPLRKMITLPNTKYLGYFNDRELTQIYNRATICVFPSYKENFPVVGLEALACGKATIATKTGFSEIIDHNKNGFLINPKNQKELKSAILRIMKNPNLRKRFEKNARKKALKYDWNNIIKEYYDIYEKSR